MYNLNLKFEHNLWQIKNKKMRIHKKMDLIFSKVVAPYTTSSIGQLIFFESFLWLHLGGGNANNVIL